jgi:hypothetical protein
MSPVLLAYNSLQSHMKPQRSQRTLQARRTVGAPQAGHSVESE